MIIRKIKIAFPPNESDVGKSTFFIRITLPAV